MANISRCKPLLFTSPSANIQASSQSSEGAPTNSDRVMEEFKLLIEQYKKEGKHNEFKAEFFVLGQLDTVMTAFICLQTQPFSVENGEKALAYLGQLDFLPKHVSGKMISQEELNKGI